ncbi:MAG: RnfABCDGE type electron transport complex subunit D [Leptospirillia bacterium]
MEKSEPTAGAAEKKPVKKPTRSTKTPADETPAYTLSYSPHVRKRISVGSIMRDVLFALLPACAVGVYWFGLHALWVLALCVVACLAVEAACQRAMNTRITLGDGSAAVTGLLLGMTMPPQAEWWLCIIGALVAIGLGKHVFGGLGYNPFNPALLGRVVLLISFPAQMTSWYTPSHWGLDAVSTATPLGQLQEARIRGLGLGEAANTDLMAAFLGNIPGSIGETSALAVLLGGLFLLWRRHITWDIPGAMLGAMALVSGISWWLDPSRYMPPTFHLVVGSAMLGAFFMATDMVTSPLTFRGRLIFGFGAGLLTIIIRQWGGYAEAISFGILLMNAAVPIIDRYTVPRLYGTGRASGGGAP